MKKLNNFMYLKLILFIFLTSCGPTLVKNKEDVSESIKKIAILPINMQAEIPREDAKFLETLIISRLKEKGYIILDPSLISAFCRTSTECEANLGEINKVFSPDAYVKTNIDSNFALNFFAGHYNTLEGQLLFVSPTKDLIYTISHTESERGGLIFNSGQVSQGLIESYNEFGTSPFRRLSQKFTESIFSVIPRATIIAGTTPIQSPKFEYLISKNNFPDQTRICVASNQRGKAELVFENLELNLREITAVNDKKRPLPNLDNLYCSNLPLKEVLANNDKKTVELRFTSFFGGTNYKDISMALNDL